MLNDLTSDYDLTITIIKKIFHLSKIKMLYNPKTFSPSFVK